MKQNDSLFMRFAIDASLESSALRTKVGAVIAKDGSVIEFGYNGTPVGWHTNECEVKVEAYYDNPEQAENLIDNGYLIDPEKICTAFKLVTKPEVVHAEMNAIIKSARKGKSIEGATLYVTLSPCNVCAPHIINAGISDVVYLEDYRDMSGINTLLIGGVNVRKIGDSRHENK